MMFFWKIGPYGKPVQATEAEAKAIVDGEKLVPLATRVGDVMFTLSFNPLCQDFDGGNEPLCFEVGKREGVGDVEILHRSSWSDDAMSDFDNAVDRVRRRFSLQGEIG